MCLALAVVPLAKVYGQSNSNPVNILQVTPSSLEGSVGQFVNVQGTVYATDDTYVLFLGPDIVAKGTADGYYVSASFLVPELPGGEYNLVLEDSVTGGNSSSEQFDVSTSYSVGTIPSSPQEGASVILNATVNGATLSTPYIANITVTLPSPISTQYSTLVQLGNADQNGVAFAQVTFPSSSFQPSGATTTYAGIYGVAFNVSLGTSSFTVGFLDSTSYHRSQVATVRAIDYAAGQTATLSVTGSSGTALVSPQSLTADSNGVMSTTFTIPSNASIGTYNVTVTPTIGNAKSIPDSESFSISGYSIGVETVNLAGETVPSITVQATDGLTNNIYSGVSDDTGMAYVNLEDGPASLTATWNGYTVGTNNITVDGAGNFTIKCQLTDLKILVLNANGVTLPFVNVTISYNYQNSTGSQTGTASGTTDPSGISTFDSVLTGISYSVSASVYNQVFNSGNNSIPSLPALPSSQEVVTCPNEPLTINVVSYSHSAIPNARIELTEITNGLFYTVNANSDGSASSQVTLGTYRLQVYQDNIMINQTTLSVFASSQIEVWCSLYGIQVSVSVVDLFGNPISNANVTINGQGTERLTALTASDGKATFNNIIGGNMQVVAFAPGAQNSYQAITVNVNQPTSVQVKIDKFVALGSLLIQSTLFLSHNPNSGRSGSAGNRGTIHETKKKKNAEK